MAGEYIGQLVLQTSKDTTTIPVTVTVGAAPFTQLNPLQLHHAIRRCKSAVRKSSMSPCH